MNAKERPPLGSSSRSVRVPAPESPPISQDVGLADYTTLGLGGPARYFTVANDETELKSALRWAKSAGIATVLLAGGSNLVVSDEGFDGLAIHVATAGAVSREAGPLTLVRARAGEPWDPLVRETVARGLSGLECLSGIPGSVGATPIQNVGAYGAEVSDVIHSVRVLDRSDLSERTVPVSECAFSYRHSRFKEEPERFAILAVTFALHRSAPRPRPLHAALAARLDASQAASGRIPSVATVREAVLTLRREKSMVLDPSDPNHRSVGSFFLNPVLPVGHLDELRSQARSSAGAAHEDELPVFPAGPGRVKVSAAWLIERAGFQKGLRRGAVGISTNHVLALVHHGGGTTTELLALAREIQERVESGYGVRLDLEPVILGPLPSLSV